MSSFVIGLRSLAQAGWNSQCRPGWLQICVDPLDSTSEVQDNGHVLILFYMYIPTKHLKISWSTACNSWSSWTSCGQECHYPSLAVGCFLSPFAVCAQPKEPSGILKTLDPQESFCVLHSYDPEPLRWRHRFIYFFLKPRVYHVSSCVSSIHGRCRDAR